MMRNKKILIIINNLGVGGAERLVIDDVNECIRRGFEVKLITLKSENLKKSMMKDGMLAEEAQIKAEWVCIPFKGFFDVGHWWQLITYIRRLKPTLICTHLWFANTIGVLAGRIAGSSCIVSFEHNVYDTVKTARQFFLDRIIQILPHKIIAVSPSVKQSLIRHGISSRRIDVVLNGIDIDRYKIPANIELRHELKINKEEFVFLFVGRLIMQKAPEILLEAFSTLEKGMLLFVGTGPLKPMLEEATKQKGLTERVQFLGMRKDVPDLLAIADCFVLPSRHEGLPIAVIEAIAASKTIILGPFESAPDLITHDKNGILVRSMEVQELAQAMERIMEDVNLRAKFEDNNAREVGRFSIKKHVDELLKYVPD